jgi:hypothetical protein
VLLTSPTLQVCAIAGAVVATGATLLLWNRVRGPQAVRWVARIALLAGSYAATALAVLLTVNIVYGGLIVSVDDLFSDPHARPMHHGGHGAGYPHGTGLGGGFGAAHHAPPLPTATPGAPGR